MSTYFLIIMSIIRFLSDHDNFYRYNKYLSILFMRQKVGASDKMCLIFTKTR